MFTPDVMLYSRGCCLFSPGCIAPSPDSLSQCKCRRGRDSSALATRPSVHVTRLYNKHKRSPLIYKTNQIGVNTII